MNLLHTFSRKLRVTCQMIFRNISEQLCLLDLIFIKPAESAANPFKHVFMSTLKMCEGSPSQANLCVVSADPADGSNMLKAPAVSFETLWLSEVVPSLDPLHSVVRDEG